MEKKVNKPQKGAAKKWAEKWEKLRKQQPPDELMDKLNKRKQPKKVAQPRDNSSDVELLMRVIRGNEIDRYLESETCEAGILADTGFLYALSDTEDRLYKSALDVYEHLENRNVAIFANVISRMEFVDLLFRKQITGGAIEVFKSLDPAVASKNVFNFFKSIRDEDTAHRNDGQSYKIPEGKLKKLREHLESEASLIDWKGFCQKYTGAKFHNDWLVYEQELGLNFVEVLEGQTSDTIASPLYWTDMVQVMGEQGIRGPDAMIANLFLKSRFPLLITADKDIAGAFDDESPDAKAIAIPKWEELSEDQKSLIVDMSGPKKSAEMFFSILFRWFLIPHELTHAFQDQRDVKMRPSESERFANDMAVAFFSQDKKNWSRLLELNKIMKVAENNLNKASTEKLSDDFFNDHYQEFARNNMRLYAKYQVKFILESIKKRRSLTLKGEFAKLKGRPGN